MLPSHALWRRLSWAIVDAWLFWEGTTARYPLWQDKLALVGANKVSVLGHYAGGLYPALYFLAAHWIDGFADPAAAIAGEPS